MDPDLEDLLGAHPFAETAGTETVPDTIGTDPEDRETVMDQGPTAIVTARIATEIAGTVHEVVAETILEDPIGIAEIALAREGSSETHQVSRRAAALLFTLRVLIFHVLHVKKKDIFKECVEQDLSQFNSYHGYPGFS